MKRLLPLVAVLAASVIAALVWIGGDRNVAKRAFDESSVENTSDKGLSLAYRYLNRSGHRALRLDAPLREGTIAGNGVLIRAGAIPKEKDALLSDAEDAFVRGGGRLVLAIGGDYGLLATREGGPRTATKVFPIWPGLDQITLPAGRTLEMKSLPPRMHALYVAGDRPVIVRQPIGRGDVIVMSEPEALQNANIAVDGHLALLLALAGNGRPVWFDESVHGFVEPDGAVELLKEWGFGPFLLLLALGSLLIFWRNAVRVGPAEEDERDTRSEAVDVVRSLGALYEKTITDEEMANLSGGLHANHR